MHRSQALQLVNELFAEQAVGVDRNGDAIGEPKNAHFLACCRAVDPSLPQGNKLLAWSHTERVKDYHHAPRVAWAKFLREIADGLESRLTDE